MQGGDEHNCPEAAGIEAAGTEAAGIEAAGTEAAGIEAAVHCYDDDAQAHYLQLFHRKDKPNNRQKTVFRTKDITYNFTPEKIITKKNSSWKKRKTTISIIYIFLFIITLSFNIVNNIP